MTEFWNEYAEMRHEALKPLVVDVSPTIISFLAFVSAVMSAHFLWREIYLLSGVILLIHGFLDVLETEVYKVKADDRTHRYLEDLFQRLSEFTLLIGVGLSPGFPTWLALAAIATLAMAHYGNSYAIELFDEPLHVSAMDRGPFVLLLLGGTLLHPVFNGALFYSLVMITGLYTGYTINAFIKGANSLQQENGKEA